MRKAVEFIQNRLLGKHLEFRVRLFNILAMAGVLVCMISTVVVRLSGDSLIINAVYIVFAALSIALIWYAVKSGRYQLCYLITIVVIFLFGFPYFFYLTGAYYGGMPYFFIFAIVFTVFMLKGKLAIFVTAFELLFYSGIIIWSHIYYTPKPLHLESSTIFSKTMLGVVAVSIALSVVLLLHFRIYDSQQPAILADGNLQWGAYFDRISSMPDEGLLDSLTVMLVPLETYLGEWENDSDFTRLGITETEYLITNQGSVSSGDIVIGQDFLLIGWDNEKLTTTEDGGLIWEGLGGAFYPKGSGKVSSAPHKAFVGNWHNETTDQDISISEDGVVSSASVWSDEGSGISYEFGYDYAEVINGGLGFLLNGIEFNAWIEDGNMVLYEVFWWNDGDDEDEIKDINEYIEGDDYDLFRIDGVFTKR